MELIDALLDSWDRQCQIVAHVAGLVDETTRKALPSPDGWPLDKHLAHVHMVRKEWLAAAAPAYAEGLGDTLIGWTTSIDDLETIKTELAKSGEAIGRAMREMLASGAERAGPYDHPVLFLQHMVWHEGWHVGLIFLGLRLAGHEPTDAWEETNVWGFWRTE